MAEPQDPEKKEEEQGSSFQNKMKGTIEDWKKSEGVGSIMDFAKSNTRDTIAFVVLFVGIIMLFFKPLWGGTLIGIVGGIYFADQIIDWINNLQRMIESGGMVKALIIAGIGLGIFIEAPMIVIGAAAAIAVRYLLVGK